MSAIETVKELIESHHYDTVLTMLQDGRYTITEAPFAGHYPTPLSRLCSHKSPLIDLIKAMINRIPEPTTSPSLDFAMYQIIRNRHLSAKFKLEVLKCYKEAMEASGLGAHASRDLIECTVYENDEICLQYILDEMPVKVPKNEYLVKIMCDFSKLTFSALKYRMTDVVRILLSHPETNRVKATDEDFKGYLNIAISGGHLKIVKLLMDKCHKELSEEECLDVLAEAIWDCFNFDNVEALRILKPDTSAHLGLSITIRRVLCSAIDLSLGCPAPQMLEHLFDLGLKPAQLCHCTDGKTLEKKGYRSLLVAALSVCNIYTPDQVLKTEQLLKNLLIKHSLDVTIEELESARDRLNLPILNVKNFVRSPLNPKYLVHKDCTLVARFGVLRVTQAAWAKGEGRPAMPEPTGDEATDRKNALAFTLGLRHFCRVVDGKTVEPLAKCIIRFSGGPEV